MSGVEGFSFPSDPEFKNAFVLFSLWPFVVPTLNAQEKKAEPAKVEVAKKEETKKEDLANLLKATNKVDSWRFEQAEGGKGKVTAEEEWIAFKVTDITGTDWHVQAIQAGLDLKENVEYKLTFEIKADVCRTAVVNAR